jgi:histidinol-phosphate/aromatic aminotransferase/cobyric acid decarboxylase-like protein
MKLYGFPTSLRVTVGRHEGNEQSLEALQRVAASSANAVRE